MTRVLTLALALTFAPAAQRAPAHAGRVVLLHNRGGEARSGWRSHRRCKGFGDE